jgi:hypothetical protein
VAKKVAPLASQALEKTQVPACLNKNRLELKEACYKPLFVMINP